MDNRLIFLYRFKSFEQWSDTEGSLSTRMEERVEGGRLIFLYRFKSFEQWSDTEGSLSTRMEERVEGGRLQYRQIRTV